MNSADAVPRKKRRVSKLSLSYRPGKPNGAGGLKERSETSGDISLTKMEPVGANSNEAESDSGGAAPDIEITPATSAYTKHFRWIVRSVTVERKELQRLLLPGELTLAAKILNLSSVATLIYARLFGRTGNFFFAEELLGERFRKSSLLTVAELERGMQELHDCGMVVFPLDGHPGNKECLRISRQLGKASAMVLLSRMGGKAKTSKTKAEIFSSIERITLKQKTLFGGKVNLCKHLKAVLSGAKNAYKRQNSDRKHFDAIVSLSLEPKILCRRLYSLFYLTSVTSGADNAGYEIAQHSSDERSNSALPNDGLMVMFGLRNFVDYTPSLTNAVFPSRESWLGYERAVELYHEFSGAQETSNEESDCAGGEQDPDCWCAADDVADTLCKSSLCNNCVPSAWNGVKFSHKSLGHCSQCIVLQASAHLRDSGFPEDGVAEYLHRFYEGSVLSSIVSEGISIFEKSKQYNVAIALLYQLLNLPWHPRRRGKFWIRTLVDANHLKWPLESLLKIATEASKDKNVVKDSGDVFEISKRKSVIETKIMKKMGKGEGKPGNDSAQKSLASMNIPAQGVSNFNFIPEEHVWTIEDRPYNREAGTKSKFIGFDGTIGCSVEELVLQHFHKEEGWTGLHCEGSLVSALFGLLLWDVIFDDTVENVFATPFQQAPLDLGYRDFAARRKGTLTARLKEISGLSPHLLANSVFSAWDKHMGKESLVPWDRWTAEILGCAGACLGGPALALIFKRLAENFRYWRGGMPDNFLWKIDGQPYEKWCAEWLGNHHGDWKGAEGALPVEMPAGPSFREQTVQCLLEANSFESILMEVKGPRDRLDGRQVAWLKYFIKHGIPAGVCRVREPKKGGERSNEKKRKAGKEKEALPLTANAAQTEFEDESMYFE